MRTKYRAIRTEYNGVTYASKAEATRAEELDLWLKSGDVVSVERQPRFTLGCPENVYVADFRVTCSNGSVHVEDVKGCETAKFRHDKKLWRRYGPCPLSIMKHRGARWDVEVIIPDSMKGDTR